jgi:hypothetical protein
MDGSDANEGQDDILKNRLMEKDTVELNLNLDRRFVEMTYVLRKVIIDMAKELSDSPIPEAVVELEITKAKIWRCLDSEKRRLRKCLRRECVNTNVNLKEEERGEVVMQYDWGDWPNGMVTCMRDECSSGMDTHNIVANTDT